MAIKPMQRMRALDEAAPDLDELKADLDIIRSALDRLLRKAEAAGIGKRRRLGRYLATLDEMHDAVVGAIDDIDDEAEEVDRIRKGVREAWARLAIAKTAADARFG